MTAPHLVLLGLAGIVLGFGLAGLMLARLVRTAQRDERPRGLASSRGAETAPTLVALIASILLTGASVAVVGVFGLRDPTASADPPAVERPQEPAPDITDKGGRGLAADASRLGDGQVITWPLMRMQVRVPSTWGVQPTDASRLEIRHPATASTSFSARVSVMPAGPSPHDYLTTHVHHARAQLAAGRIAGFMTRRLGALPGVVTVEQRGDGGSWLVTWTGFEPAATGSVAVTLQLGAAGVDFDRDESLLGGILDTVRFQ